MRCVILNISYTINQNCKNIYIKIEYWVKPEAIKYKLRHIVVSLLGHFIIIWLKDV